MDITLIICLKKSYKQALVLACDVWMDIICILLGYRLSVLCMLEEKYYIICDDVELYIKRGVRYGKKIKKNSL